MKLKIRLLVQNVAKYLSIGITHDQISFLFVFVAEFGIVEVICMNDDNSLLLLVDVKDILHYKVKLDNTKSYDSIKEKNKQVANNIINNSRVLYNNIINNKINEEIDNRIHSIEYIKCNEYNEKEKVKYQSISNRKTISNYLKYVIEKCGDISYASTELNNILDNTAKEYFEKQQQATTRTLNYKGHAPRTIVLKKLERIGMFMDSYESVVFTNNDLNEIISDVLDRPDERTSKAYYECLLDYSRQIGGLKGGMFEVRFNMRGFSDTVKSIRGKK